ncbi:hypothetical protein RBH94_15150 [Aestuariibaculum sp. YM273]|uniref:hypothetical protein n=1 Tax=Aestuariibaculum sp. YM273 TaxID=3070659 RepID=UPI0027DE39AA|nr:hypothetical protein [Aestuariibaculum sp. YM273]WMI65388.1 hypothetical protein RBH94_15150 [Aestuariibaculum sp. YM273]
MEQSTDFNQLPRLAINNINFILSHVVDTNNQLTFTGDEYTKYKILYKDNVLYDSNTPYPNTFTLEQPRFNLEYLLISKYNQLVKDDDYMYLTDVYDSLFVEGVVKNMIKNSDVLTHAFKQRFNHYKRANDKILQSLYDVFHNSIISTNWTKKQYNDIILKLDITKQLFDVIDGVLTDYDIDDVIIPDDNIIRYGNAHSGKLKMKKTEYLIKRI